MLKWKKGILYIFEFTNELLIFEYHYHSFPWQNFVTFKILSLLIGYILTIKKHLLAKIIQFSCLILNLSLLHLTTVCFAVNPPIFKYLKF